MDRAWVDGRPAASVPLTDRGLQYGDGVFRTLLLWQGRIVWRQRQIERLRADALRIGLTPPEPDVLQADLDRAAATGQSAALKLMLTAGDGPRGYARAATACRRILLASALPDWPAFCWQRGVSVETLQLRLGGQPALGGSKHLNRLEQVLARTALPEACQEGLLCDTQGALVGGTMSNLFWYRDGVWHTPTLDGAGVAGLSRTLILEQAQRLGLNVRECHRDAAEIALHCERVFVCNALIGIWPVARWGTRAFTGGRDEGIGLAHLRRALRHPLCEKYT